jgi:hypothetical protein
MSDIVLPAHANRSRLVSFDLNNQVPFLSAGMSNPIFHGGGNVLIPADGGDNLDSMLTTERSPKKKMV